MSLILTSINKIYVESMAKLRFEAICDGTGKAWEKLQTNTFNTPPPKKKTLYLWWLAKPLTSTYVGILYGNRQKAQLCKEKKRAFTINSRLSSFKYRSVMRVFRVSWTFRFFKTRSFPCLKQMGTSYPVKGRHASKEQIQYFRRLDNRQGIVNITFS